MSGPDELRNNGVVKNVDEAREALAGAPQEELATFKDSPRHERSEQVWPLAALGLQPGDRVTYRLEVFDNDSVSGRKKGISATMLPWPSHAGHRPPPFAVLKENRDGP